MTVYLYARDRVAQNMTSRRWPPCSGYVVNTTSLYLNAVTNEIATCSFYLSNYDSFYASYCGNTDDVTNNTALVGNCNATLYNGTNQIWRGYYLPLTGLVTGGTNHSYTVQGINSALTFDQDYAITYNCWDDDGNSLHKYRVIKMNTTSNAANLTVQYAVTQIANATFLNTSTFQVNVSRGNAVVNLTYILYNSSLNSINTTVLANTTTAFTWYIADTNATYWYAVNGTAANGSSFQTLSRRVTFDTLLPVIAFNGSTSLNNTAYNRTWIYAAVNVTEANQANITFVLYYANRTLLNTTVRRSGEMI